MSKCAKIEASRQVVEHLPTLTTNERLLVMAYGSIRPNSVTRIDPNLCCYCGSPWDVARDHVIPTSYLREKRKYEGDWLVPACRECNSTLSDLLIFNVPARARYILRRYLEKYQRVMRTVAWDDDELAELGRDLRQYVEAARIDRQAIDGRVRHLRAVAAMPIHYLAEHRPYIDPDEEDAPDFVDLEREKPREIGAWARKSAAGNKLVRGG